jgi:F-type H+-transporting ATPase subunit delta
MEAFALQYAHALADVVMADKLDTKEIDRQLEDFQSTWTGSRQLREVFQNPSIQLETKLKVLDAMVPRIGMLKQVRNFVALLLQNDRIHAVESITSDYRNEINRRLHISEAEITSVRELNPEEKSKIEAKASALAGLEIRPVYKQDASLLGGVVLRIGDTVYDLEPELEAEWRRSKQTKFRNYFGSKLTTSSRGFASTKWARSSPWATELPAFTAWTK